MILGLSLEIGVRKVWAGAAAHITISVHKQKANCEQILILKRGMPGSQNKA